MRIAYVRDFFPKLSETFILEEILHLKRAGHDVRIFARQSELIEISKKILDNGLLECVTYENVVSKLAFSIEIKLIYYFVKNFLFSNNYRKTLFRNFFHGRDLKSELNEIFREKSKNKNKIESNFIKFRQYLEIWKTVLWVHNLSLARHDHILRQDAFIPDHVHAPFLFKWDSRKVYQLLGMHQSVSYTAALRSRDVYFDQSDWGHLRLRNHLIQNSNQIFAISKFNKNELSKKFLLRREIQIVHSSIDSTFFSPNDEVRKKTGQMACVARLVPKKGLDLLLDTCAVMDRAGQDFQLSLVGGGILKDDLLVKITKLGLTDKVKIIGPFGAEVIRDILNEAEMFVLPCVVAADGDRDMLPNSLKEAMAMKLPVVTTNISGIEELITDGVDGLLAKPNDAIDLATKVTLALTDKMLAKALGENARKRILDEFSILGEGEKFSRALNRVHSEKSCHVTRGNAYFIKDVPDFSASTTNDRIFQLSDCKGKNVVLIFVPSENALDHAKTTAEFRDLQAQFHLAETLVFGISDGDIQSCKEFKSRLNLPFELISDPDRTIGALFNVVYASANQENCIEACTFVINASNQVTQEWRGIRSAGHAYDVLEFIRTTRAAREMTPLPLPLPLPLPFYATCDSPDFAFELS